MARWCRLRKSMETLRWLVGFIIFQWCLVGMFILRFSSPEDVVCLTSTLEVNEDVPCTAFTVDSRFPGGLANTMGAVNHLAEFSIKENMKFLFPYITPKDLYSTRGDGFTLLFGEPEVKGDVANKAVRGCTQIITANCQDTHVCDPTKKTVRKPKSYVCEYSESYIGNGEYEAALQAFETCSASGSAFMMAFYKRTGCKVVLLYDAHDYTWHFDYARTLKTLRTRYHKARHEQCQSYTPVLAASPFRKFTVAIHHRKCPGNSKEMSIDYDLFVMQLLVKVISVECLDVQVHSLYRRKEDVAVEIIERILELGVPKDSFVFYGYDDGVDSLSSLHAMVDADVLVAGTSGYPRLAAVLKNMGVTIAVDALKALKDHPLSFLDDVYEIPARDFMWNANDLDDHHRDVIRRTYENYDDSFEQTFAELLPSFQLFMEEKMAGDTRWPQCRRRGRRR